MLTEEGEIMELFKLFGTIGLNDKEARQGLRDIDNQAANTGNKLGGLSRIGTFVGTAIAAGATAAVGGISLLTGFIGKTGIAYNAMSETSKVAWETLLGTQEKAVTMLEDIANFAKTTQFETAQVDQMAKYMHNAGLEGQALFNELTKVADVAGAFSIPAAEAQEMARQMAQVRNAGVAYTEDLNILEDRGVPIMKTIAKNLGITTAEAKKMAGEGKITADIYLAAFDTIAKGVEGSSEKQSKTYSGMLSTLKDNLDMISGVLMQGAFDYLKTTMETALPVIERFSATLKDEGLRAALSEIFGAEKTDKIITFFTTIKDVGVGAFNLFKDAIQFTGDNLNWIIPIMSGAVAGITAFNIISTIVNLINLWKASTFAQTLAQYGLNAALTANPIGLVIVAIGALVAMGVALYMNWDTVKEKTRQLWDKLGAFQGVANLVLGPLGFLIRAAVDLAENWDSTKSVWENVWSSIKRTAANAVNEVITSINKMIGWINSIPGVNVPIIPKVSWGSVSDVGARKMGAQQQYATGTNWAQDGWALVGERGPEIVHLPGGAKVKTARETNDMLKRGDVNINVYPQKAIIDEKDIEREFQRAVLLYG